MTTMLGISLAGRHVVMVGGGAVAARRLRPVPRRRRARPRRRARALGRRAATSSRRRRLDWIAARGVRRPTSTDAWLVHTATGDPRVDADVAAACEQPPHPLRQRLATAPTARPGSRPRRARATSSSASSRMRASTPAARAGCATRSPRCSARAACPLRRRRATAAGRVDLVGGGPGPADLMTVRGRRLLAEADVVVADRLGPTDVLAELDPDVEVIDVGKRPGHHPVPQDEINALLVEHARARPARRAAQGRRSVRLRPRRRRGRGVPGRRRPGRGRARPHERRLGAAGGRHPGHASRQPRHPSTSSTARPSRPPRPLAALARRHSRPPSCSWASRALPASSPPRSRPARPTTARSRSSRAATPTAQRTTRTTLARASRMPRPRRRAQSRGHRHRRGRRAPTCCCRPIRELAGDAADRRSTVRPSHRPTLLGRPRRAARSSSPSIVAPASSRPRSSGTAPRCGPRRRSRSCRTSTTRRSSRARASSSRILPTIVVVDDRRRLPRLDGGGRRGGTARRAPRRAPTGARSSRADPKARGAIQQAGPHRGLGRRVRDLRRARRVPARRGRRRPAHRRAAPRLGRRRPRRAVRGARAPTS